MYYLIDGYNLIFSLIDSKQSLQSIRQELISSLQKQFALKKMAGTLVFDGARIRGEESGLSYPSPLTVAYAPRGQTADSYILEQLELSRNPKEITVITNDKGLSLHARAAGAKIQGTKMFIAWLYKKKKKDKTVEAKETPANIDRLLKIFEDRLKNQEHLEE